MMLAAAPRLPTGARCTPSMAKSSAATANVPALTMNAAGADATASSGAPIAGPTTTARSHTVEQRVGGAEAALTDEPRQQGQRRRSLRAPCRRRERDEADHQRDVPVTGHRRRQDEHEHQAHQASRHEHGTARMTVGDRAPSGPSSTQGRSLAIVAAPTHTGECVALKT